MMKYLVTILTSLYNCEPYLETFFDNVFEIEGIEKFELLLLHNAPKQQEVDIIRRRIEGHSNIKHIIIPQREGLYSTWNRGILMANAEYITNWNVDDRRTPSSLMDQYEILEINKEAAISYGDYYVVKEMDSKTGILNIEPDSTHNDIKAKNGVLMGPLPMWRKSLHEKLGYYDEQFKLCADTEFQFRVAHSGYKLVKVEHPIGFFLSSSTNLSNQRIVQAEEAFVINRRYGIHDQLNPILYRPQKYKCNEIKNSGKFYPIEQYMPNSSERSKINTNTKLKMSFKLPIYAWSASLMYLKDFLVTKLRVKEILANLETRTL